MIDIKKIQAAVGAMDQVQVRGGKLYTQVAQRVEAFRVNIGDELGMESELQACRYESDHKIKRRFCRCYGLGRRVARPRRQQNGLH